MSEGYSLDSLRRSNLVSAFFDQDVVTARKLVGDIVDACLDEGYDGLPGIDPTKVQEEFKAGKFDDTKGEYAKIVDYAARQHGVTKDQLRGFMDEEFTK